ncbi:MAG: 2-succinyl-5-enolpyruvyl-6-hydroxy-3-cyclohexene-1-carboxylic-acid synthase [Anaerolineae bacterium]|nr:2-succinyl-5-enolpyruvyl-6-hydroxy-3-cyclohexene-1-carboxylic-acid synthase [Anaerolineae bacterium]MDW8292807.1 2-succinyl-5-enolpyruvyl-6-hydroxy-3-cyclohexene-1-carboxylic-acid synthase [Anaerolineae bacterium]
MSLANRNTLWAHVFVEELQRAGVDTVVIAPGSRSTPLALAFAEQPGMRVISLLDERGAAFFALGLARASGHPAAVLCSSGTAAANFFPAVVEASQSRVPLIVLTADRPPEERDCGANQTIDQIKLFGGYVRWFFEVPLPEAQPPEIALRALRQLAARAVAEAQGLPASGPVHLNFPFRKPLEPTPVAGDAPAHPPTSLGYIGRSGKRPITCMQRGIVQPTRAQLEALAARIHAHPRGAIVLGKQPLPSEAVESVAQLAARCGYPILADALSNARFGQHVRAATVCGSYELILPHLPPELHPDFVLHIGGMPVGSALERFLDRETTERVMVSADGTWEDAAHTASEWLWADPTALSAALMAHLPPAPADPSWAQAWAQLEAAARHALEAARAEVPEAEEWTLLEVLDALPDGAALFVGNSLPVRHLDQVGLPRAKAVRVFANRGASGIDGVIATAAGVASANPNRPVVLVIGDVSFYHDLNSLLALVRAEVRNLHIVLINNGGGAIFQRLPIAAYEPPFRALFFTEHGLSFEAAAALFKLRYRATADVAQVGALLRDALAEATPSLLEVHTDPSASARAQAQLARHARAALQTLFAVR